MIDEIKNISHLIIFDNTLELGYIAKSKGKYFLLL